ncbi:MAG: putative GST-like protein YibF [Alphaproteobacteria bacterium MarineAlpha11_Bin1]|nr:MAG: putative GST-like protein YibF [Alphaproteobacteria bacterium MarineAlpha11_Bin1]|tara:strand:+ start:4665 stop:5282 length:618 start_codon:yes stop_codon:yes gene_type:complete
MKLRWSPTSPFVRKVIVFMKEKGIEDAVEKEKSNPLSREDRAATPSPLGQIPCLITDDGLSIYDSPVILEFLDVECSGPEMLPRDGKDRWTILIRQALADGMIGSMVVCFVESLKKPERQSPSIMAHNKNIVFKGISELEKDISGFAGNIDVGTISVAVALAFADQTFPDDDWRADCQSLAEWFDEFNQRPSMTESALIDAREFK